MLDIKFDITQREVVLDGGDFVSESNPSEQNGGILLYSRCAFLSNPQTGIGIEEIINNGPAQTTFELNRWRKQAITDGATLATWTATPSGNGINIETNISYE